MSKRFQLILVENMNMSFYIHVFKYELYLNSILYSVSIWTKFYIHGFKYEFYLNL